jgi:hypothetical protein
MITELPKHPIVAQHSLSPTYPSLVVGKLAAQWDAFVDSLPRNCTNLAGEERGVKIVSVLYAIHHLKGARLVDNAYLGKKGKMPIPMLEYNGLGRDYPWRECIGEKAASAFSSALDQNRHCYIPHTDSLEQTSIVFIKQSKAALALIQKIANQWGYLSKSYFNAMLRWLELYDKSDVAEGKALIQQHKIQWSTQLPGDESEIIPVTLLNRTIPHAQSVCCRLNRKGQLLIASDRLKPQKKVDAWKLVSDPKRAALWKNAPSLGCLFPDCLQKEVFEMISEWEREQTATVIALLQNEWHELIMPIKEICISYLQKGKE